MTTHLPYSVETALADSSSDATRLGEAFFYNLGNRLESGVLTHSKANLDELAQQLHELAAKYFAGATESVKNAAWWEASVSQDVAQAYSLGQLNFAQLFISSVAQHRAENGFAETMSQSVALRYLKPLLEKEMTNSELAQVIQTTEPNLSRKLREFRELGITDFRKDGRSVFNFLTHAARLALEQILKSEPRHLLGVDSANDGAFEIQSYLEQYQENLPNHLKVVMNFGGPVRSCEEEATCANR